MTALCTCGCCAGISLQTPRGESNLPGLSAIAYRTGTWGSFLESMLARLSSSDYPALAALKTRDNDDFTIALLDASAVVFDILTFYQERLANESYLRTATQLYSMVRLSQLIGFQPSPGVAAWTYLAFRIKAATGLPSNPATTAITIPAGTQVQSVPAQGQSPQTFETSSNILAKADWNALPVQSGSPWMATSTTTSVYLDGTSSQLNPGDTILILDPGNVWAIRTLTAVQADTANGRTLVSWSEPLTAFTSGSSATAVYAMRQRAALFGYNAVNPLLLAAATQTELENAGLISTKEVYEPLTSPFGFVGGFIEVTETGDWYFATDSSTGTDLGKNRLVDLDAVYPKILPGSWLVLARPNGDTSGSPSGKLMLYRVTSVTAMTRSDYGASGKITRLLVDNATSLDDYYAATRSTGVFAQSEQLAVAQQPFDHPLYGSCIDLAIVRDDLAGVVAIAVTGKGQKLTINGAALTFVPDDGTPHVSLAQGETVTLVRPPDFLNSDGSVPNWNAATAKLTLYVADSNGRTGTITGYLTDLSLAASADSDPIVQEVALVSTVSLKPDPFPRTRIVLQNALVNCYERGTKTTVNANVGPATAGSSVTEVLGGGSASTPNQKFTLKQSPLTYVSAPTPTGRDSTLQVRANGVAWKGVQTLYNQAPAARVFATLNLPGGIGEVDFGDGVEGATLPTGLGNIQASFRVGLGSAGNVETGALTTLINRPLGVAAVTNPLSATGGQDAQTVGDIRASAPLTVLTLGRAVSITDYQNFAATFAGIAKASAIWIPSGTYRGVFLTLAGAGGTALVPPNATLANLVSALETYGNPNVAIWPVSFIETIFSLSAAVGYDPSYDAGAVRAAILARLTQTYSFASRTFGQGVSGDEVAALIQGVAGVTAVNVKSIEIIASSTAGDLGGTGYSVSAYNAWMQRRLTTPLPRPSSGSHLIICPFVPVATSGTLPSPAEILVLDPDPKKVVLRTLK
ncbi:MAG: putative baseplate assembly protein [Candidatus Cybelea sp.]